MKILLFSRLGAYAQVGGEMFELSLKTPLEIAPSVPIQILPKDAQFLPFCFTPLSPCPHIKNINFQNFVMAEVLGFPQSFVGGFFTAKTLKSGTANVFGAPYTFNVNLKKSTYSCPLPSGIENIEIFETTRATFCRGALFGQTFVSAFHKSEKVFKNFTGSVLLSEDFLEAVTPSGTLAGHGQYQKFDLSSGFTLVEKSTVYLGSSPRAVPPFLNHIAFFEAVREEDFTLAKTYLEPALSAALTPSALKNYFGKFDSIKVLSREKKLLVALITNQTDISATAQVFSLKFSGPLISDIQEED